ncbi:hypothetical protein Droror1_Dr00018511, partial [Drosera rotundifolia]
RENEKDFVIQREDQHANALGSFEAAQSLLRDATRLSPLFLAAGVDEEGRRSNLERAVEATKIIAQLFPSQSAATLLEMHRDDGGSPGRW